MYWWHMLAQHTSTLTKTAEMVGYNWDTGSIDQHAGIPT